MVSVRNNYAIVLKENGQVIGAIGLNEDADNNPDARNVGILLLDEYHNRGIMSEALKCVIQNISNITKKLSYACSAEDKRSQHIAEKFGFRYVKTLGNAQGNASKDPIDMFYYILEV